MDTGWGAYGYRPGCMVPGWRGAHDEVEVSQSARELCLQHSLLARRVRGDEQLELPMQRVAARILLGLAAVGFGQHVHLRGQQGAPGVRLVGLWLVARGAWLVAQLSRFRLRLRAQAQAQAQARGSG